MSIASAPERIPELELHYRPLPGVAEAALMNELLDAGTEVSIEGPFGDVRVAGPLDEDLLLIAGGSGISQCRAILEHLRCVDHARDVTLVWSVTQRDHLYADAELRGFAPWLELRSGGRYAAGKERGTRVAAHPRATDVRTHHRQRQPGIRAMPWSTR